MRIDVSDLYYAAVLSQLPSADIGKPQCDYRDERFACTSGEFIGVIFKWSAFANEAFAIVCPMARLIYLTACANMRIYTERNNLSFIFGANWQKPTILAYLIAMCQRWALTPSNSSIPSLLSRETYIYSRKL